MGDSRSSPCSSLGLLSFCPGTNSAPENDLAAVCINGDVVRIDLSASVQRGNDAPFYFLRGDLRLQVIRLRTPLTARKRRTELAAIFRW